MCLILMIFASLLQPSFQISTPSDDSYVAAVVEYEVLSNTDTNIANYIRIIKEASEQNADIVVFPEMTLNRGNRNVEVPIYGRLKEYPVPALHEDLYDSILVSMSSAARNNRIYVVINVQEEMNCANAPGEECPENKVYLFNTDVVFDRNGAVIDRYRKINLFGEFTRTPALKPELGIFTTDFGVTFGHFICFDLMFQVPAVQLPQKHNVTDVIFPTMWFSEMPYLTAVQIQEAYAYAMNVNFLAAGANNVRIGSAGSGIYSGKAGALISIMPGVPTTRLLVAKVPKVPGEVKDAYPGPIYDNPSDHDNLLLKVDPSLASHRSRLLQPGLQEFTLVDGTTTCRFKVSLSESPNTRYKYRAGTFDGVRTYDGVATGGVRICAVYACTDDTRESCGKRFPQYSPNSFATFQELTIEASFATPQSVEELGADDAAYFPVSLKPSILPLEADEFSFSSTSSFNTTDIYSYRLLNKSAELYNFGIFGRVFDRDGQEPTPPLSDDEPETTIAPTTTTASPECCAPGACASIYINLFLLMPAIVTAVTSIFS
ncbi:vanin-like protein 1 isoform X2 [Zerene cesonia]|uniref:vanin-like protein 1 isoform X2 n=1 Tax=Zerene cesonia TaxID=33412 RepID=UPI0018E51F98|nr:vanin-like protein 1 isoform X2 [Zerene cesonia]